MEWFGYKLGSGVQHCSIKASFSQAWCHAVFCVETSIISRGNKILYATRCGISPGIHARVYTTCVVYTAWLLGVEASYKSTTTNTNVTSHNMAACW